MYTKPTESVGEAQRVCSKCIHWKEEQTHWKSQTFYRSQNRVLSFSFGLVQHKKYFMLSVVELLSMCKNVSCSIWIVDGQETFFIMNGLNEEFSWKFCVVIWSGSAIAQNKKVDILPSDANPSESNKQK